MNIPALAVLLGVLLLPLCTAKALEAQTAMDAKLNDKQAMIAGIAAFTAKGDLNRLKTAANEGLDAGLTINEIKEVLVQLYAYAGFAQRPLQRLRPARKPLRPAKRIRQDHFFPPSGKGEKGDANRVGSRPISPFVKSGGTMDNHISRRTFLQGGAIALGAVMVGGNAAFASDAEAPQVFMTKNLSPDGLMHLYSTVMQGRGIVAPLSSQDVARATPFLPIVRDAPPAALGRHGNAEHAQSRSRAWDRALRLQTLPAVS